MPYMNTIRALHYNLKVAYVCPQYVSLTPSILTRPLLFYFQLRFLSETHSEYVYNYICNTAFYYIYGDIGHSLGVFAVLFQRCNSAVETIWFCPMLISTMYL